MRRNSLITLVLFIGIAICSSPAYSQLSRGHQWQRNHEMVLTAMVEMYGAGSRLDLWEPLNFSCLLRHGMGVDPNNTIRVHSEAGNDWMVFAPTTDQSWFDTYVPDWRASYPGNIGWQVGDEATTNLSSLGALLEHVRGMVDSDTIIYSNAMPSSNMSTWPSYIHDFRVDVSPDVLMFDVYPFRDNALVSYYFHALKIVRDEALAGEIPYWLWLQAFGFIPTYSSIYEPSESDMRLNIFSAMAFGYSGFCYWTYDSNYSPYSQCILSYSNAPTHMYDSIVGISEEIRVWGNVMAYLTSTSIGWIPGGSGAPAGLSNWTTGDGGDSHILSVSVNTSGTGKNGLLGIFADDSGDRYFMLVNTDHAYDKTAAECETEFTITFDSSVDSILSLDRDTHELHRIHLTNNQYTFTLPGGTGDIFKYDDGEAFPGQRDVDYSGYAEADLDDDGKIGLSDLSMLSSSWLDSAE